MPKQGQRAEVNTFIQGLITEASPLNFPPNASKEEENFDLFKDGTRRRRKGMNFEDNYTLRFTPINLVNNTFANSFFEWNGVAGDPSLNFLVVAFSNVFHVFDTSEEFLTHDGYLGYVAHGATGTTNSTTWQCTSIEGKLVCVGSSRDVFVISYDKVTEELSIEVGNLKVRDFWGIATPDTVLETNSQFRPTDDYLQHRYNLANQSWGLPRKNKTGAISDPVEVYHTEYGKYPSNSELVWTGLQFQAVQSGSDPYERIFPSLYQEVFGLNPPASRGYFIIDLINRGDSRVAAYGDNYAYTGSILHTPAITAPEDRTIGGPSCLVEYAGRVFYSGFEGEVVEGDSRSPNLVNYVVFSQVVQTPKDIFKCYQEGDPTSRDGSDIVDTDGGYIRISGASKIVGMKYIGNNLVVLAENGIWAITGGSDFGFSATNYKVSQISSFGCSSLNSIVTQGDSIMYWGASGIYSIAQDKFGALAATNLTQSTIQKLYDAIPEESRNNAYGVYDDVTKKARWIYKEGTLFTDTSVTRELVLDFNLSNFTLNRIYNPPDFKTEIIRPVSVDDGVKYVTLSGAVDFDGRYFTLSEYWDETFVDWKSVDDTGVDAKAFVLTGSQIAGDSAVQKQLPYIVMHFRKTETETDDEGVPKTPSGCLFRMQWDWANTSNSNKFTPLQQAYRYRKPYIGMPSSTYDNGFETVTTKNKVRGSGRAFSLYMETEPLKDCNILGWNLTLNGNAVA